MKNVPLLFSTFFTRPVPVFTHVAAGRPGNVPFSCRGYGFRLDDDHDRLFVSVMKSQISRFHEQIDPAGRMAALFTSGVDNESYQVKGQFMQFRPVDALDVQAIERQIGLTAQYLPQLLPIVQVSPMGCCVLEMTVDSIYEQTPGPHAGRPLPEEGV